jgi:hypothetical protein
MKNGGMVSRNYSLVLIFPGYYEMYIERLGDSMEYVSEN